MSNALRADRAEIDRALRLILEPGQVTELRALEAVTAADGRPHTQSGYYDSSHVDELATAAAKITAKGIYLVINPIEPALIARAANRIKRIGREPLTSDSDIIRRCRLPIDCDPVRPSGISSSDDEHCAALCRARQVRDALQAEGWPAPILADSGNGAHVLFRIDLAADDGGLVQRCLEAIAARFDDPAVTIDQKVFNPARIWRLYGTPARKGDCTPDRPHRLSRIIEAPSLLEVVPAELLEKLAAGAPRQGARERRQSPAGSFDIERWIYEHKLEVRGPELWQGGRRWVFKACPWNSAHTDRSAFIAQHASGAIVARCHHNSCNGKDWHALRDVVEPPWRERSAKAADNCERREHRNGTPTPAAPVLIPMSTVKAEPVKWLWPGRIALGKITVIQGDPDVNKSFLTLDLAARVTRGTPWPDAPSTSAPLGGVVLLTAEDDLADTVRPRLDAAGADVSRINVLQAVQTVDTSGERHFSLETDLLALEDAIKATPNCRLATVDPISAYLGKIDSHNNAEVRAVLAPLGKLAARLGVAVVCVNHLRKSDGRAMHRGSGSLAFTAGPRAVWLVARDKDNPTGSRRLFVPVKNNIAPQQAGLAFTLHTVPGATMPCLSWDPAPVHMTADEALELSPEKPGPAPTKGDAAEDWLEEVLADGPVSAATVKAEAKAAGLLWRVVQQAGERLKVIRRKVGFVGGWTWSLSAPQPVEGAKTLENSAPSAEDIARAAFSTTPDEGAEFQGIYAPSGEDRRAKAPGESEPQGVV